MQRVILVLKRKTLPPCDKILVFQRKFKGKQDEEHCKIHSPSVYQSKLQ